MLSGDNGLLKRAGEAREDTVVGQEKEQVELAYISAAVKKLGDEVDEEALRIELNSSVGNGKTSVSTNDDTTLNVYFTDTEHNYNVNNGIVTPAKAMPTVTTPPTTAVAENTKYKDTNNDIAVIPTGFRVSNNTDEQTIETGLVVKDSKDNEWVWIPVDNVNKIIDTTGAPYTLCGETEVTTSKTSKSEIISEQTRTIPGTTISPYYREPDLVLGSGTKYDYANYSTAEFTSLQNMAQSLVDDYEKMTLSVRKYGGFFVGRYELTGSVENPTEISGETLTNQNWYNLYKACKGFTTDKVESRMIWGCQWDIVCNFIAENSSYNIMDSSTWGNYKNTKVLSSDGTSTIKASGTSSILNTGVTTFTMAKNIYDMAGNYMEFTQEAAYSDGRAYRRWQFYCYKFSCISN